MMFKDRTDAGRRLAKALIGYKRERPLVLALPRGGVPVGYEVARALEAPLDVLVVRKLGAPWQPEYAIGAVAEGAVVLIEDAAARLGIGEEALAEAAARKQGEIEQRIKMFRDGRSLPEVRGRTVIVVDDGIATGATARAALRAIRVKEPARLVLAVPVAAADSVAVMRGEVDDLVCLSAPVDLMAVGCWYEDFEQVSDEAVVQWLKKARALRPPT